MALLRLAMLGPFLVMRDDQAVTGFESNKARALLAYLACEPGKQHSREALAELLWPEHPAGAASANLRHVLANLRRALDDSSATPLFLLAGANTIQLNPASVDVDVPHFERLVAAKSVYAGRAAVNLVRGSFLEGLTVDGSPALEEWLAAMRELVDHKVVSALGYLAGDAVQQGDYAQAVEWTRRQTALEPWNEEAHSQLMALLALGGQRTAALHQAELSRKVLAAELDIELQPATEALVERIREGQVTPDDLQPFLGKTLFLAPQPTRYRNLPSFPTPFFGRRAELAGIASKLADPDCRLLTIVGPGGIGKTRLAVAAAMQHAADFAGGACFVGLTAVTQGSLLADEILRALETPSPASAWVQLVETLRDRELLLVLDNFEQLVESAGLLAQLLDAAPKLKLLVTSRTRLDLRAEWLFPVEGLETPESAGEEPPALAAESQPVADWSEVEHYSAVQLFVHGMRRLQPNVALTLAGASAIVRICRLLDGNPLAIELAAGWTRTLPPSAVLEELGRGLDLLATTQRDTPERHRSIRAVFDHTWTLLTPREQSVLRQLSVFRGGFTPAAAEAVAGASPADLAALVDKSWLRMLPNGRGEMHELVRQYCEERLEREHEASSGETVAAVRDRFGAYFTAFVREQISNANFASEVASAVAAELGNLQVIWDWVLQQGTVEAGADLVIAVYAMADMLGWLRPVLQIFDTVRPRLAAQLASASDPERRAVAGGTLSWLEYATQTIWRRLALLGEAQAALARLEELIEAGVATPDMAQLVLGVRGWQAFLHGRWTVARHWFAAMADAVTDHPVTYLIMGNERGPGFWAALGHQHMALCSFFIGDYGAAHSHYRRALALREEIGEMRYRGDTWALLAILKNLEGDPSAALPLAQQAAELCESFGDRLTFALARSAQGQVQTALGQYDAARAALADALAIGRQSGDLRLILEPLAELGRLELARGDIGAAKAHFEAGLTAFAKLGEPHSNFVVGAWLGLGWAALAEETWKTAQARFVQTITATGAAAWQILDAAAGLAEVYAAQGNLDEAASLLALVEHAPPAAAFTRRRAAETAARLDLTLTAAPTADWRMALDMHLPAGVLPPT